MIDKEVELCVYSHLFRYNSPFLPKNIYKKYSIVFEFKCSLGKCFIVDLHEYSFYSKNPYSLMLLYPGKNYQYNYFYLNSEFKFLKSNILKDLGNNVEFELEEIFRRIEHDLF